MNDDGHIDSRIEDPTNQTNGRTENTIRAVAGRGENRAAYPASQLGNSTRYWLEHTES